MAGSEDAVERLKKFWEKKHLTIKCPICGNNDFAIDKGAELYVPRAVAFESGKPSKFRNEVASFALYCTNCAYVINFMTSTIDDELSIYDGGETE